MPLASFLGRHSGESRIRELTPIYAGLLSAHITEVRCYTWAGLVAVAATEADSPVAATAVVFPVAAVPGGSPAEVAPVASPAAATRVAAEVAPAEAGAEVPGAVALGAVAREEADGAEVPDTALPHPHGVAGVVLAGGPSWAACGSEAG